MAWDEAQYVVDEIMEGMKTSQITGIPPQNLKVFSVSAGNQQAKIKCTPPADTIIDGQLICTVAGVKIVRKTGKAPIGPEDGTLVLDVLKGQSIEAIDGNLTNGVTYYYGFFPYSDHGVYNYNQANTKAVTPSAIKYWAFDQNFADKNPGTTISYPSDFVNSGFDKMHTNEGTGTATAGGWLEFLQDTLKNYPFMVDKAAQAAYALNPSDYTKKKDGSGSDYNNTGYNGGAFAWLNKIYMLEEFSSNGESRRVTFADGPADGFTPVGFYDYDGNEMEGIWLPMGYMDANGRTLIAGTTPVASKTTDQEWSLIKGFSSRAVFLGGPIMNVLRDLEYMMFKSTDIQSAAGHGRCNAGYQAVIANQVVANGAVPGWKGTSNKTTMNKYFHSQVLGSYQQWTRDPYTLLIGGKLKMSDRYIYDLTGAKLIDTGLTFPTDSAWQYPCHLLKAGTKLGSVLKLENTGSTSTGLCDGLNMNASGTRVGVRQGDTNSDLLGGPATLHLGREASNVDWTGGVGVILLPPAGYAPKVQ